jgi:hypothetical protein
MTTMKAKAKPTRIVLAEMPTLMSDMIEGMLSMHPDLKVVARTGPGEDVCAAVRYNRADVLITGQATVDEAATLAMFSWRPTIVLTVSNSGQAGMLWVLRPDGTPIGELSAESLIAAARMAGSA